MPEFLTLVPPEEARLLLLSHLADARPEAEEIEVDSALGRISAEDIFAPHALPEFPRSTVDGYAVRARDTHGASDSQPSYVTLAGELPMGAAPAFGLNAGECALIHTGGMLPNGADAIVMLEHTQIVSPGKRADDDMEFRKREIEILRAVAEGENVIRVGEDVASGGLILPKGRAMRPAEVGGLMALGIPSLRVARKPRVGILSSGDEVVSPNVHPRPGQVRDVNSHTLAALVNKSGGEPIRYGIVRDEISALKLAAARALSECDLLVITAGSSASTRDMTAEVIRSLGAPGVLVHGVNTRPGKPTILGVCDGKAVIGLPGNPVSALVNAYLFVVPVIEKLLGASPVPKPSLAARLTVNLSSQAGREDWWPVKLLPSPPGKEAGGAARSMSKRELYEAEPIFGKSNLIFNLVAADGLLRIPPDATGLAAGEQVEVYLF